MSNCKAVLGFPSFRAGNQRLTSAVLLPINNINLQKSFQVLASTKKMLAMKATKGFP